jgi:hypothetical protein
MPALTEKLNVEDNVGFEERKLRAIAREIAMDIIDVEVILASHKITPEDFTDIAQSPSFQKLLAEQMEEWNTAQSTRERVEKKTFSMLEEFLPQAWQYLHSPSFGDTAKVSLLQALQKQVGIGLRDAQVSEGSGQKVQITINMSRGNQVKVDADVTPNGNLIEGEVINA